MKKILKVCLLVAFVSAIVVGCNGEDEFESGDIFSPSNGTVLESGEGDNGDDVPPPPPPKGV